MIKVTWPKDYADLVSHVDVMINNAHALYQAHPNAVSIPASHFTVFPQIKGLLSAPIPTGATPLKETKDIPGSSNELRHCNSQVRFVNLHIIPEHAVALRGKLCVSPTHAHFELTWYFADDSDAMLGLLSRHPA